MHNKTLKVTGLCCLLLCASVKAIVTRHDVHPSLYLASGSDFPPLATFYVDRAHGTLIRERWLLTAAHATFCLKKDYPISIGSNIYKVKKTYVHRDYKPGKSHDIALIELTQNVEGISPASLYTAEDELSKKTWFIGIGGTGSGLLGQTVSNRQNNGVLRKAENTIIQANGPLLKFRFNSGDLALPLEGVSGSGDSGGPAYIQSAKGYKILGISSRIEGTDFVIGEYGVTEVYTRVSFFGDWINKIIEGDVLSRNVISLSQLKSLPSGLTELNLGTVCNDIKIN